MDPLSFEPPKYARHTDRGYEYGFINIQTKEYVSLGIAKTLEDAMTLSRFSPVKPSMKRGLYEKEGSRESIEKALRSAADTTSQTQQ